MISIIPRIIHYCWLSGDPIPADYQRCMDTWREKLTGYEFVLWDLSRFDINSTIWTKQAMETGLYAFAADYIRLYAVYHHGGIYLDMDMEVVKPFDELLNAPLMIAYENHIGCNIEAGCFGAEPRHPFIRRCMEYYETRSFVEPSLLPDVMARERTERADFINPLIAPEVMKNVLNALLNESGSTKSVHVYSWDYFTAKNVVTGDIEKTKNTFTIHHFGSQYHSEEWRKTRKGVENILKTLGEKSLLSKICIKLYYVFRRVSVSGLLNAGKYYYKKYIHKKY